MSYYLCVISLYLLFALTKSSAALNLKFIEDVNGNILVEVEHINKFTLDELMKGNKVRLICEDRDSLTSETRKNIKVKLWVTSSTADYDSIVAVKVLETSTRKGKRKTENYDGIIVYKRNIRQSSFGETITLNCENLKNPENSRVKRWSWFKNTEKPVKETEKTTVSTTSTVATSDPDDIFNTLPTEDDWWRVTPEDEWWPIKLPETTTTETSLVDSELSKDTITKIENPHNLKLRNETSKEADTEFDKGTLVKNDPGFSETTNVATSDPADIFNTFPPEDDWWRVMPENEWWPIKSADDIFPETTTTETSLADSELSKDIENSNNLKLRNATSKEADTEFEKGTLVKNNPGISQTTTPERKIAGKDLSETKRLRSETEIATNHFLANGLTGVGTPIPKDVVDQGIHYGAVKYNPCDECLQFNANCTPNYFQQSEISCQCPNKFTFKPSCYTGLKFRCDCPKGKTYDNEGRCIVNVCNIRGRKECSKKGARCRLNHQDPTRYDCLCRKGNFMGPNEKCIPVADTKIRVYDESQTVRQGQTVFIRCRDEGRLRLQLHWKRPGNLTLSKFAIIDEPDYLVIPYSQPSDSGAYYCFAGQKYSRRVPQKIARLNVIPSLCSQRQFECKNTKQCIDSRKVCDGRMDCHDNTDELACQWNQGEYPNDIKIQLHQVPRIAIQGSDIRMFCSDEGPRRLSVEWFRSDNRPLPLRSVVRGGYLLLKNVKPRDSGYYVCKADGILLTKSCCQENLYLEIRPQNLATFSGVRTN